MIKPSDIVSGKEKMFLKCLAIGSTGTGKTYFASTFPKSCFLITEPGGEDTFMTVPELQKNVVMFDRFIPSSNEDTKRVFIELDKACNEVREKAISGEIETVVLDNLTYLTENRWIYINNFEQELNKNGELDTRGMYGKLARWLYHFTLMKLLTIPANLVITVHEKMESDDVMDKKPDKTSPVVPSILGGFRDDIGGMVSLVLYLVKLILDKVSINILAELI
jgi:hypothetical protein